MVKYAFDKEPRMICDDHCAIYIPGQGSSASSNRYSIRHFGMDSSLVVARGLGVLRVPELWPFCNRPSCLACR